MENATANTEFEQEQLKKLETLRKLTCAIVLRHVFAIVLVFCVCLAAILFFAWRRTMKSPQRFQTTTKLLFQPKETTQFAAMDNKKVMQILSRRAMFQMVAEELRIPESEKHALSNEYMEIRQGKKQPDLFTITACGNTADVAIRKANALANLCIREYAKFRMDDLQTWKQAIQKRQAAVQDDLRALLDRRTALAQECGVQDPVAEMERLRQTVAELKSALSEINLRIGREEAKKRINEAALGKINPALFRHAGKLKESLAELKRLDQEILVKRQLYTDSNPKLLAMMSQRDATQKEYERFLRAAKIDENLDEEALDLAERMRKELAELVDSLETLISNRLALQREIDANEKAMRKLMEAQPAFSQMRQQNEACLGMLKSMEEASARIEYLMESVKKEMLHVEPADFAVEEKPFNKKNLAIALFAAMFLTGAFAMTMVLLEIAFGRVRDFKELSYYSELNPIGEIPANDAVFENEAQKKTCWNELFYRFQNQDFMKDLVFLAPLPGAALATDRLCDVFEWNYAVGGRRMLRLTIVPSMEFVEPSGSEPLGAVWIADGRAVLPLENPYLLSPSELQLLTSDLAELRRTYDVVFIVLAAPLKLRGVFLGQMLQFCDCAILLLGEGTTSRHALRHVMNCNPKGKPFPSVFATGAKTLPFLAKGDA